MATLDVEEHAKKPGVQKLIRPIYELSKKGTDSFVCFTGSLFGVHYVSNMENIRHFLTRGRKTDDRGASPEAEIAVGADANFIKKPAYSVHPKVTQRKFNSGQFTK